MAASPGQGPSMEQFEAYFQKADLDRDGRISGAEAVAFFQGSNLPNQILAQIWMHSDRRNTGFLGRAEFYIALRLVTVAQSGQQLTKEIIKAALEGSNAVKIPPPQINPMATSTPVNPISASMPSLNRMPSPAQMGTVPTTPSQRVGSIGPQVFPNASMNQQFSSNITRPIQATVASSLFPMQPVSGGLPGGNSVASSHNQNLNAPNLGANWLVGRSAQASDASIPSRGVTGLANQNGFEQSYPMATASAKSGPQETSFISASLLPKPVRSLSSSLQPANNSALVVSGNGFSSGSVSGVDAFSVTQPKQDASFSVLSASKIPSTSNTAATMIGYQPSQSVQVISPANMPTALADGGMLQNSQSLVKQNQQGTIPSISGPTSTVGIGTLGFSLAQSEWPKMTRSNIQKYTKVFVEVDKDRDGKITGEEARNLFLSWRLPREVLKQVWDLSDQDGDGMLSLREFCIALYLMERYREGHPLPTLLPNSLVYDEALLQVTNQPSARQGSPQQGMPGTPQQGFHVMRAAELKPHQQVQRSPQVDGKVQPVQQKSGVPILEKHLVNQLSNEEQNALSSKLKEATDAEKKVQELEKKILESNQKIEFYRTKMQELVIYKSRYDNRLNEITERASTDKREVEALTKKYEEKCKEVGDVASKLTAEEATFHDIQGKKLELFNAIVKMNDGEKDNSVLQVCADSIQSDLDELVKGLNARCKKYGLRVKPTTLVELPFGWQPGIQESAADWDEDWDKFEDEVSGLVLIKELTVDVENIIAPPKSKAPSVSNYQASKEETSPNVNKTLVDTSNIGSQVIESELSHAHSENGSVRSLPGTPSRGGALESPSHQISSPKYEINDIKDNQCDHGATDSTIFGETYADDQLWGTNFDTHDDTDSIWGFDPMNKATGDDSNKQNSFFGYEDFGLNPIRTGSPSAASVSGMDRPFFDSVPSTPSGYSGFSPRYEGQDPSYGFGHFDSLSSLGNLSRFDSINSRSRYFDRGDFFTQHDTFARFDSIRSSRDSNHGRGFPSVDDADPFGSRLFKSSENHTPRGSDNWSSF